MSPVQAAGPERIVVHIFHDDRVAFELMSDWYSNLDLQMLQIDDGPGIRSVLQPWAIGEYGTPKPRYVRQESVLELGEAYTVEISKKPTDAMRCFTGRAERLSEEFERAFFGTPNNKLADTAQFANTLTESIREFISQSRLKAAARLADGSYIRVLEAYLADMRSRTEPEDQGYYRTVESGIALILRDEQYLRLSLDRRVRELYQQIHLEENALYQWWMNLNKGDISGPR